MAPLNSVFLGLVLDLFSTVDLYKVQISRNGICMPDRVTALTEPDRASIVATLIGIRGQLDHAGEALAAAHISQAIDCLDPNSPINHQAARKLH